AAKINVLDSLSLLPHSDLEDKIYGITNLSVINIRMKPGYDEESGTQTLLGTPLRVLEKRNGWLRIVTPEGYIAWVTSGSVARVTEEEAAEWRNAPKWVVNTHYTLLRAQPAENADVVCDAVWGCIVRKVSEQGKYYKVLLPNGKNAYLLKAHAQDFTEWLDSRKPTPEKIIATAKQFLGFPYMWGGTSIKGMDCSGFTKTTYYLNGIILQRDASQQVATGVDVDITNGLDNLKMGDLIFFGRKAAETQKERATHVGIYIGEGEFIHCATSVRINSLLPEAENYYEGSTRLIRARRILGNEDTDKGIWTVRQHPWYF
ncbi:MAG: C40 family peptidase, partial [Bacteroidales bacterium]